MNVLTHGAGFVMSCWGFLHLLEAHLSTNSAWQTAIFSLYALSWIVLFCTSTLYHASSYMPRKTNLRVLDHCAIFIVIAASYGPFVLHVLNDAKGYTLWLLSWLIAIGGCIFKFKSVYRYHVHATWVYLFQGGMVLVSFPTLMAALSGAAFTWFVVGGVALAGGTYFYVRDDVKYNHCAWHLCVLLGCFGTHMAVLDLL
ncbi:MAG: hemolysin III family protein [Vulcanimicrobiota bacterium]